MTASTDTAIRFNLRASEVELILEEVILLDTKPERILRGALSINSWCEIEMTPNEIQDLSRLH